MLKKVQLFLYHVTKAYDVKDQGRDWQASFKSDGASREKDSPIPKAS